METWLATDRQSFHLCLHLNVSHALFKSTIFSLIKVGQFDKSNTDEGTNEKSLCLNLINRRFVLSVRPAYNPFLKGLLEFPLLQMSLSDLNV